MSEILLIPFIADVFFKYWLEIVLIVYIQGSICSLCLAFMTWGKPTGNDHQSIITVSIVFLGSWFLAYIFYTDLEMKRERMRRKGAKELVKSVKRFKEGIQDDA